MIINGSLDLSWRSSESVEHRHHYCIARDAVTILTKDVIFTRHVAARLVLRHEHATFSILLNTFKHNFPEIGCQHD